MIIKIWWPGATGLPQISHTETDFLLATPSFKFQIRLEDCLQDKKEALFW